MSLCSFRAGLRTSRAALGSSSKVAALLTPRVQQRTHSRGFGGYYKPPKNLRTTKVVLLQDYVNIGSKGEVVEVRPGYHRKFLHPHGIAVYATADNIAKYALEGSNNEEGEDEARNASLKQLENRNYALLFTEQISKINMLFNRGPQSPPQSTITAMGDLDDPEAEKVPIPEGVQSVTREMVVTKLWSMHEIYGISPSMVVFPEEVQGVTTTELTRYGTYKVTLNMQESPLRKGLTPPGITTLFNAVTTAEEQPQFLVKFHPNPAKLSEAERAARDTLKEQRKAKEADKKKAQGKKK